LRAINVGGRNQIKMGDLNASQMNAQTQIELVCYACYEIAGVAKYFQIFKL